MRFDAATHTVHANGRTWQADPAGTQIADDLYLGPDVPYVQRRRRCLIRFESGWAASIIWGGGTYSTNHDAFYLDDQFTEEPTTVEVGVLDHTGELRQRRHRDDDGFEWHDVESYLDDPDLAALLDHLAALPTDADYGAAPPTITELMDIARAAGLDLPPEDHRP